MADSSAEEACAATGTVAIAHGQYFTVDIDTADGTDFAVVILAGML